MNKLIKNLLYIFEINRLYRYAVYFTLLCFVYFGLFAEHNQSIIGLFRTGDFILLWYYLGYLLCGTVVFSVIGLILFNRQVQCDETQKQDVRNARKRFFNKLSSSLGKGGIWFLLMVMALMGTDSCGASCFPLQGYIQFFIIAYPVVVGSTLFCATYAFLLRELDLMDKLLRISNMWLWSLTPVIFMVFLFLN